jgi:hypothetical protein
MKILITRPDPEKAKANPACPAGPWPVVYFFSGFSARAGWYSYIANRLASYGYVVVQYNLMSLVTIDSKEVRCGPEAGRSQAGQRGPGGGLPVVSCLARAKGSAGGRALLMSSSSKTPSHPLPERSATSTRCAASWRTRTSPAPARSRASSTSRSPRSPATRAAASSRRCTSPRCGGGPWG